MSGRFHPRKSNPMRKSRASRRPRFGRRISLEALEDRRLLSAGPWLSPGVSDAALVAQGHYRPIPPKPTGTTPTSLSLGLSAPTTAYGQSLVATATLTFTSSSTPTGKVTFTVDGRPVQSASVADAASGVTLPAIDAGSHTIGAYYSGDATFAGSTATGQSETVTQASTTVALTTSDSTPTATPYGEPIVLTATVTPTAPGGGNGGGLVEFLDGTTQIAEARVNSWGPDQGEAVAVVSSLSISGSPHSLTADYLGNTDYTGSTSNALPVTIVQAATTTVVTGWPNPAATGQSVTFVAHVLPSYSSGSTAGGWWGEGGGSQWLWGGAPAAQPTGSVVFTVDAGTANVQTFTETITANGMAEVTIPAGFSSTGLHTVTATYLGDANYAASPASPTYNENVGGVRSQTQVTVSPKPAQVGQDFTVTVTVGPGRGATSSNTPTGTVTLVDPSGTIVLASGSSSSESLSSGQATFTADFPTAGVYALSVQYSGDANFAPSTGYVWVRVGTPSLASYGELGGFDGGWTGQHRARDGVFAHW
ncbi:MAG: Ig-like domain-containing protein [Thermoguttaceae bacterium]